MGDDLQPSDRCIALLRFAEIAVSQKPQKPISSDLSLHLLKAYCSLQVADGFVHRLEVLGKLRDHFGAVAVLHGKKTIEEFCQYIMLKCIRKVHILDFDNLADVAYITIGWCAILRQASDPSLEKPFMAVFSGLAWLRALYTFRGEIWMGPRLLPILSAIKDTQAFFMVTGTCILAAAHAYHNLQMKTEPSPSYAAFLQVIRLGIFGDFDLYEFEGLDPTYKMNEEAQWEPQDPDPGPDYVALLTGVGSFCILWRVFVDASLQSTVRPGSP